MDTGLPTPFELVDAEKNLYKKCEYRKESQNLNLKVDEGICI